MHAIQVLREQYSEGCEVKSPREFKFSDTKSDLGPFIEVSITDKKDCVTAFKPSHRQVSCTLKQGLFLLYASYIDMCVFVDSKHNSSIIILKFRLTIVLNYCISY